jgi:hypothetical protein
LHTHGLADGQRFAIANLIPKGNRDRTEIKDIYSGITNKIIADLGQGVRPWLKP